MISALQAWCVGTRCPLALTLAVSVVCLIVPTAESADLQEMTGCWVTPEAAVTSLETDSSRSDAVRLILEKMLLIFDRMEKSEYLVFGHIYEWSDTTVLGPQYQNGVFDPVAKNLTFGFPEGGLDTVYSLDRDTLLYIHKKSSAVSAMSVRRMTRLDCTEAEALEGRLRAAKQRLANAAPPSPLPK